MMIRINLVKLLEKIDKAEMNVIFREDYKEENENSYINEEIFF